MRNPNQELTVRVNRMKTGITLVKFARRDWTLFTTAPLRQAWGELKFTVCSRLVLRRLGSRESGVYHGQWRCREVLSGNSRTCLIPSRFCADCEVREDARESGVFWRRWRHPRALTENCRTCPLFPRLRVDSEVRENAWGLNWCYPLFQQLKEKKALRGWWDQKASVDDRGGLDLRYSLIPVKRLSLSKELRYTEWMKTLFLAETLAFSLDSLAFVIIHWNGLRTVQFKCKTSARSVTKVQRV